MIARDDQPAADPGAMRCEIEGRLFSSRLNDHFTESTLGYAFESSGSSCSAPAGDVCHGSLVWNKTQFL